MVAPNLKKATNTNQGTAVKYGAPDIVKAFDIIDGTHPTERIQAWVIEGLRSPFNASLKPEGSNFVVRDGDGGVIHSGASAHTAMAHLLLQGGHLYIGPGLYNTTSSRLIRSNTFLEADVNAIIRGAGGHPVLRNQNITQESGGDENIIVMGGTWDGNTYSTEDPELGTTTTANLHFAFCKFLWVHKVRSINAASECVKARDCDITWMTENYTRRSRLQNNGTGKAGLHSAANSTQTIIANNILEDSGGEAIGIYENGGIVHILNNICRYVTFGRNHILHEGTPTNDQWVYDTIIAYNNIYANYYGINLMSVRGCQIHGNTITTIPGSGLDGHAIRIGGGESARIDISNNLLFNCDGDGIRLTNQARDCIISNNRVINCGRQTPNTYSGIVLHPGGGNMQRVKVSGNLIVDDQDTKTMKHGIVFTCTAGQSRNVFDCWTENNQIYGTLGDTIHFDWADNSFRLQGDSRMLNNTGFNPHGKVINPFNNSHDEVGIPRASTANFSYSATPTANTAYTVVMSPISLTSVGGSGVSITIRAQPGSHIMLSDASTVNAIYMPIGWTVNFGSFSSAPTVQVIGL